MGAVLIAKSLGKVYGHGQKQVQALSSLDISVKKNEFVCLVGPNGCGKSTFLKIAAGLTTPSSGECKTALQMSYMPQESSLLPWRSVKDNLRLPTQISGKKSGAGEKQAEKLLDEFGLVEFADFYPHALSGGMKQKAALIRAVITNPRLLLLDEPFSALDAITRRELQNWLLKLWQKQRPAVVCVTHDVREAILLADTIYVISGRPGTIKEKIEVKFPRSKRVKLMYSKEAKALEKRLNNLLAVKT